MINLLNSLPFIKARLLAIESKEKVKRLEDKVKALEDELGIEYFNGPKYKPHYRKRKTITKKLGRPRKQK